MSYKLVWLEDKLDSTLEVLIDIPAGYELPKQVEELAYRIAYKFHPDKMNPKMEYAYYCPECTGWLYGTPHSHLIATIGNDGKVLDERWVYSCKRCGCTIAKVPYA